MAQNIIKSSGIFAANQGNSPNQSGYAIELQQNKGDNSTIKYFEAMKIGIEHTAKILVNAIPKVYDTKRIVRILGEDGSSKQETINDDVYDADQQKMVSLNDVRKGKYDVTCDIGPAFRSRQQETARAFLEAAEVFPALLTEGADVWLSNLNAPGMGVMAERMRKALFEAGKIPDSQMTDEEKERAQQMIAQAQAEAQAAAQQGPSIMEQAVIEQTQANTADIASRAAERNAKIEQGYRKQDFEEAKFAAQLDQEAFKQMMERQNQLMEQQMMAINALNKQADTLKILREAIGAQAIIGPENTESYVQQSGLISDAQESMGAEEPETES